MSITPRAYADVIKRLPPLMKAVLTNGVMNATCVAIDDVFALTTEQSRAMMNIVTNVIAREYPPHEVYLHVFQEVRLPEERSKLLARELLGRVFLPMAWYLGNLDQDIQQLGGDLAVYRQDMMKWYPELNAPVAQVSAQPVALTPTLEQPAPTAGENALLANFEDRLTTFRGRAEILLRLTGLSATIDEAMHTKNMTEQDGQQLLQQLDSVSAAINTQDLNPFEVQSLKRRVERVLEKTKSLGL